MVTVILSLRFTTSIAFHDVLNGSRVGHNTGTASIEAKMLHQLTDTRDDIFYEIFMDL